MGKTFPFYMHLTEKKKKNFFFFFFCELWVACSENAPGGCGDLRYRRGASLLLLDRPD